MGIPEFWIPTYPDPYSYMYAIKYGYRVLGIPPSPTPRNQIPGDMGTPNKLINLLIG